MTDDTSRSSRDDFQGSRGSSPFSRREGGAEDRAGGARRSGGFGGRVRHSSNYVDGGADSSRSSRGDSRGDGRNGRGDRRGGDRFGRNDRFGGGARGGDRREGFGDRGRQDRFRRDDRSGLGDREERRSHGHREWDRDGERRDRGFERRDRRDGGFDRRDRHDRGYDRRDDRRDGGFERRDRHDHGYDRRDDRRDGGFDRRDRQDRGYDRHDDHRNTHGFHENRRSSRGGFGDRRFVKDAHRQRNRPAEPEIPESITAKDLDPAVRQDLSVLNRNNADMVAKHLAATAMLMEDDPQRALAHARAAKERAARVGVVRETLGIAAYHAGEWKLALTELRTARRILGGPGLLAVMADCERGLGRPEAAIEMAQGRSIEGLDDDDQRELSIVVAGAYRDLGDLDNAIARLQSHDLDIMDLRPENARIFYAYADALVAAGRVDEARGWFEAVVAIDPDGILDAAERLEEIDGTRRDAGEEAEAERDTAPGADAAVPTESAMDAVRNEEEEE